jgi:hypothetical protein
MPEIEPPAAPDPPELIKWLKWIGHYLSHEGAVIRQAPGAAIFLFTAAFVVAYLVVHREYEDRFAAKDSTIQSLNAAIQFQDERLQSLEGKPTEMVGLGQSKLQFVNFANLTVNGKFAVNVWTQNVGNAAAISPIHADEGIIIDHELTRDEINNKFSNLHKSLILYEVKDRSRTDEEQPGAIFFHTVGFLFSLATLEQQVLKGPNYFYLFSIMEYRDSDVPASRWRVSESCKIFMQDKAALDCDEHNRIFLSQ